MAIQAQKIPQKWDYEGGTRMVQTTQTPELIRYPIVFVYRTVAWDGYLLLDDIYQVLQPVFVLDKCTWEEVEKYGRIERDHEHGICYVPAVFPREVFTELLRAGAVKNVGEEIKAWHWDPLKAAPILRKHGYKIHEKWLQQYMENIKAYEKCMEKLKEWEQKHGTISYYVRNGVLVAHGIGIADCHTGKEYSFDYKFARELTKKYNPLNKIKNN